MGIGFSRSSDFVEQRRARRAAVVLDCSVRERSRSALKGEVRDLSPLGCRIESPTMALAGNQLWVRLPGLESTIGTVIWSDGHSAGVMFDQPLHPAVAVQYMPDVAAMTAANDSYDAPDNVIPISPLLSRREQIVAGIADTGLSPLSTRKRQSSNGMQTMISRTVQRRIDTRAEPRHADQALTGPMELSVDGQSARVADVSSSGLRVFAEIEAEIGQELAIDFTGFDGIAGRLVWMGGGEAGFSLPTDALDLEG